MMKRRRILSLALALIVMFGLAVPALALGYGEEYLGYTTVGGQQYSDVPTTHWAYPSIETCSQRSWFNGYPDGSFHPEGLITREEAAKVFAVAMGLEIETDPTVTYTDTKDNWAKAYIEATKPLFPNVVNLQGTSSFRPTQTITREETIYALVVAWGYGSKTKNADLSVLNMFSDKNSISAGVKPYMAVAVSESLVSGLPDGTIAAQKGLTRAEFAALLARALNHGYGDTKQEFQAPSITLKKYASTTAAETLTVSGTVTPAADVKLTLDGEAIKLGSNGSFSAALSLDVGSNTFTLVAENTYGAKDTKTITVERTEELEIAIDPFESNTNAEEVTVTGTVSPSKGVTLTLDGKEVAITSTGAFQLKLTLQTGANTFNLAAKSAYGSTATKTITIGREMLVPVLVVDEDSLPPDVCELGDSFTITGHIENYNEDCRLKQSATPVEVDKNGYFRIGTRVDEAGVYGFELFLEYKGQALDAFFYDWFCPESQGAGQWLSELPSSVRAYMEYYQIEEKTEYRYKYTETQTSSAASLAGWTLVEQGGSWGGWSNWQDAAVSGSGTRKVETRQVEVAPGKTEYRYGGWHDPSNYGHFCPNLGKSDRGTNFTLHYTEWSTTRVSPKYTNWQYCDNANHNHVGGRWYNGHHYWDRYGINGLAYYWEETRTTQPTYKTQYRYQDFNASNVFQRETDWSAWTEEIKEPGVWSHMEMRTLYRYSPKI